MTKEEKLAALNARSEFNKYNGIVVKDFGNGCSLVETELIKNSMNPWGSAHGGLVFSMCDVAAGVAVMGMTPDGVTQSASIYYLRPATGKKLRAEGRVIKDGRSVALVETNVYNDDGDLVASGKFEYFHTGTRVDLEKE
jgi:uncharacterized protein (TIGR00369 family)